MSERQRQMVDVKPLPPPPPPAKMLEEKIENDYPRNSTSDLKEVSGLFKFKKLANKLTAQFNATSMTVKTTSTARVKNTPPLVNDFTSKEQREAALRERGLIAAPKKVLSELEQDLDQRYAKTTPIPQDQTTKGGQPSAAEKIMQEWKAKNKAGHP